MKPVFLVLALLADSASADWSISNRLPFEEGWRDPSAAWVGDSYFQTYEEVEVEPYLCFLARNYLAYNPIRKSRNYDPPFKGFAMVQNRECHEVADCTGDGVTDLMDFAKYAAHYRPTDVGVIRWPAKPVSAKCLSELELAAELWMMNDVGNETPF